MVGIANDLNINQLGIQSFNNVNGVFTGVTITGGTGITVTNGNGQTGNPTISLAGGSPAVEHLTGDTGGALNPDGLNNFNLLAHTYSGSSVFFNGSGSTINLAVTDSLNNTMVGFLAGNASISGTANTGFGFGAFNKLSSGINNAAFGYAGLTNVTTGSTNTSVGHIALQLLTTGSTNVAVGDSALNALTTGSSNTALGYGAGFLYTSSESSNIVIGNQGTVSESNTIRIGTQGNTAGLQNACYIAGIVGVTVANTQAVTINSSTGQLGVTTVATGFSSVKVTLTSAQIKALKATPVTILAAQGANTVIYPVAISAKYVYGGTNAFTNAGVADANLIIYYTNASGLQAEIVNLMTQAAMTGTANIFSTDTGIYGSTSKAVGVLDNTPIVLANVGLNEYAGNAAANNTLIVDMLYWVATLT